MSDVLDEFVVDVQVASANSILSTFEERIRLVTQDKPRWMPTAIWHRVLRRVVKIEVF